MLADRIIEHEGTDIASFDMVWQRIMALEGEEFTQKNGQPFRYAIRGNSLIPTTTNRQLPRSQFAKAFDRAPLDGPGQIRDLQGPSYLYAILTDTRVTSVQTPSGPDSDSP